MGDDDAKVEVEALAGGTAESEEQGGRARERRGKSSKAQESMQREYGQAQFRMQVDVN